MRRAPGRLPHSFKPLLNPLEFFKSPSNFFNIVIIFSKHMPKLHSTNFPTVLFNTKDDCRPFKEFEVQNDMGDKGRILQVTQLYVLLSKIQCISHLLITLHCATKEMTGLREREKKKKDTSGQNRKFLKFELKCNLERFTPHWPHF